MSTPDHECVYVLFYIRECADHYYKPYHDVVDIFKTRHVAEAALAQAQAQLQQRDTTYSPYEVNKYYIKACQVRSALHHQTAADA